jgi:hypothetical protein
MHPTEFKELKMKLKEVFRQILANCYTDFTEIDVAKSVGQIFTISAFYGEEYISADKKPIERVNIVRPILHFQADGIWKNEVLDINNFFSINEDIFEEFYEMGERNGLDLLIPILKRGEDNFTPKNIGQASVDNYFFISVESSIQGSSQFNRDLLDEGIATIAVDNSKNSIEVSCSLSERQTITPIIDLMPVTLKIPFDKAEKFQSFQKGIERIVVDEKYIFVAMSFQKDPLLEDTYTTIQRSIKNLRKGLKCERVDDIQEDFVISDKIFDCIRKAKMLIVDLTGNRPNVYYELGFARALGKSIILLCKEGDKPHFDVSNQNTIFYNNATTLEKSLNIRLRTTFR